MNIGILVHRVRLSEGRHIRRQFYKRHGLGLRSDFSLTLFQKMTIVAPSEEPCLLTPMIEHPGSRPELSEAATFKVPETAPWNVTDPDEW